MSTSFHLCQSTDLDLLVSLAMRRAEEAGTQADEDRLRAGLAPLAEQSGDGAAYLFGPAKAPVGYLVLTFGWSIPLAGREARIADLYIRPSVRRRGLATEALIGIGNALRGGGLKAMHVTLPEGDAALMNLASKAGFRPDPGAIHATRAL